jgi:DNA-binding transcriptional LysR family regulator
MDRLDTMSIFIAAVDEGSLAAAARKLGRSPATITRAISLLEDRLGHRLLHRTGRWLKLTEVGERQFALYRTVLASLEEGERLDEHTDRFEGTIAITASELLGRLSIMPLIEEFLVSQPRVRARVLLSNRVVNLVKEGLDIAVRIGPLQDSNEVAVRVGEVRRLVCAAPSYIDRVGLPGNPADLQQHDCIGEEEGHERENWRFAYHSSSQTRSVAIHPRIALNSTGAAVDAAIRGRGLCRALSHQVAEHVAAQRLVTVLSAFEPAPFPVHLVFHTILPRNAVLRAFVDYMTPRIRAELTSISAKLP